MAYLAELRTNWRPLAASIIGLGAGFSVTNYITSIMAPQLLAEFQWSKSAFALVGTLSLSMVFALPVAGRMADVLGVRRTAMIGVVTLPITFILLSMMTGHIGQYIAIYLVQALICITTTTTVYSRAVVQYIDKARGLALAICASGPAITGALGSPLLNDFVEAHGWRAGYQALAVFSLLAGGLALALMPPERKEHVVGDRPKARRARDDYPEIFRNPSFWILLAALLLCNLPHVIVLSQLKLVLIDRGADTQAISIMLSAFAMGVLAGRFVCGVALDRLPPYIVSAVSLGLPAVGLLIMAAGLNSTMALTAAVVLLGLAFGAEGDLVGFLVVRKFGVRVFSSVLGLLTAAIAVSGSLGAALLSLTLALTGTYTLFLNVAAAAVFAGCLLFPLLGREGNVDFAGEQAGEAHG